MKQSTVNMGTLYDINKIATLKEKPLTLHELSIKSEEIKEFCINSGNQYFMLLNREKYDFTLFNLGKNPSRNDLRVRKIIFDDLIICLKNRGNIVSIDLTKDKSAYEIWVSADDNAFVYYFFPYDQGVIE